MEKEKRFCPALWFSGFFGLGAVVHLVRLVLRFSVVVNGFGIPLGVSAALAAVLGTLSIGLLILGIKKPCEHKGSSGSCCK